MLIFVICLIKWRKHFSVVPLYAAFCRRAPGWQKTLVSGALSHSWSMVYLLFPALLEHCLMSFIFFPFFFNTAEYQFVLGIPALSPVQ